MEARIYDFDVLIGIAINAAMERYEDRVYLFVFRSGIMTGYIYSIICIVSRVMYVMNVARHEARVKMKQKQEAYSEVAMRVKMQQKQFCILWFCQ